MTILPAADLQPVSLQRQWRSRCSLHGPLIGIQARLAEASLGLAPERHRGARRPDRHRHSGSSREPGDGDGADHARCRRTLSAARLPLVATRRTRNLRHQTGEIRVDAMLPCVAEGTNPPALMGAAGVTPPRPMPPRRSSRGRPWSARRSTPPRRCLMGKGNDAWEMLVENVPNT